MRYCLPLNSYFTTSFSLNNLIPSTSTRVLNSLGHNTILLLNNLFGRDGLARAEASRAADAADVGNFRSSGIHCRLRDGVFSDNVPYLHGRSRANFYCYHPQLAILQPPSSQLVRPT